MMTSVEEKFFPKEISLANLDIFIPRKLELDGLTQHLPYLTGHLLDAGCGRMPYRAFILNNSDVTRYTGLDLAHDGGYDQSGAQPDLLWEGETIPAGNACFDAALSTQVLEHCPDPSQYLKEVARVLKPGGPLYLTVPFLWNLHDVPHDEYRYTPFSLSRMLEEAGFSEICISATGGWHASMATMIAAYACRAPLGRQKRWVRRLAVPVVKWLMKKAASEPVDFMRSPMITGLRVICKKG